MERNRFSTALVGLGLALLASLALAAHASAFIYWADSNNDRIGRAENDGSGVNPSFIQTGNEPTAVAVDSGHVYWANQGSGTIGRAKIDGTEVNNSFLTGLTEPDGVAVNASAIFWSTLNGAVGKANLNGTSPNPSFITAPTSACGVALDSGHVYWVDPSSGSPAYVGRAGLDGGSVQATYVKIEVGLPCGVAVSTSSIYWADFGFLGGGTRIGRANTLDGKGVDESFISGGSAPCGVSLFGGQLYWANAATDTIARANSDGTAVNQSLVATGGDVICGVAVDSLASPPPPPPVPVPIPDTAPPQTQIAKGPGTKLAQGKAKFSFRSSEPGSHFQCRLDKRKVRPCSSPKKYSGLKPGRHLFKVWAIDAAGNKDPTPAKKRFRVPS